MSTRKNRAALEKLMKGDVDLKFGQDVALKRLAKPAPAP